MSPRAVYRYVPHTIRHDPDCGVVYEIHCTEPGCVSESGHHAAQEAAQDWALRHTGRTGHNHFRRIVTDHALTVAEQ
ncbi:hypothetical protein F9278_16705 [Streptomyces phaeolivaceus]|uniref:DUF7848 domain-containing protein n=1 Tax=Streptomyces phaeolivaceus TaxID=2653200 RepID=A0A5P8K4M8_9ACTN|nr:hypothetical protein [Streptomyces phaeolivaceus]QFQ97587.1 hypothetical protein F9278_16705 [Streptomyces phaeolivaceus]